LRGTNKKIGTKSLAEGNAQIKLHYHFLEKQKKDWNEKTGRRQRPNKTILASFHVSPNKSVKRYQILD
jgi:hypothetical protein